MPMQTNFNSNQKQEYLLKRQAPLTFKIVSFPRIVRSRQRGVNKLSQKNIFGKRASFQDNTPYQTGQIYRTESKVSRFVTPTPHFPKKARKMGIFLIAQYQRLSSTPNKVNIHLFIMAGNKNKAPKEEEIILSE